ncbi:MAG: 16S rRNA (guanine(966)-N(2))-methyltransferase RsmD [Clostridia bacterium]|nr:16S rRNA (guanine(966)-N(2))-methyltransferase RsmD [Clostridia bacterium]
MRVITGSARGRNLITLEGGDVVRPTTDRVKEAMFSIIQFDIEGRRVLDLFAGSGQLGIEALSRGAEKCTFVDSDAKAVSVIEQNLAHTQLSDKAVVRKSDSLNFLRTTNEVFDIVIIDPPYGTGLLQKALDSLDRLAEGGIIVCELPVGEDIPESAGGLNLFKRYKYGRVELAVYR